MPIKQEPPKSKKDMSVSEFNLRKLFQNASERNKLWLSDSCRLMVLVRQIIEERKQHKKFPTLWFYCNWILHPELTNDRWHNKLSVITNAIMNYDSEVVTMENRKKVKTVNDYIAEEIICAKQLRQEFQNLFNSFNWGTVINGLLNSKSNWRCFLELIFKQLLGKPSSFDSCKKNAKIRAEKHYNNLSKLHTPKITSFELVTKLLEDGSFSPKGELFWKTGILEQDYVYMQGKIFMNEFDQDFKYP